MNLKLCSVLLIIAAGATADEFGLNCDQSSCGQNAQCSKKILGTRCECPPGFMGAGCHRPCQDIYKSCDRWLKEGRCTWASIYRTPFFNDHCAASCNQCVVADNALDLPIHWMLEPLLWLVGQWETTTSNGRRFPLDMESAYRETLDFDLQATPMFDRPPLNFTATAQNLFDETDVNREVGFVLSLPFEWNNGFVDKNKPKTGSNRISLEMNSNTGINTIETGNFEGQSVTMVVVFVNTFPGYESYAPKNATRTFSLQADGRLREDSRVILQNGATTAFSKTFDKVKSFV